MNKKNQFLISGIILIFAFFFYSCKDLIEEDFTKKTMSGLVPANNQVSANFNQSFRWDEIEGTINYRLQIANPDFVSPLLFVADTLLVKNNFSINLTPGKYQWRVRAMVGESYTDFVTHNLSIDSSLDLLNQTVLLSIPTDNFYTNSLTSTFSWQTIPNAESYIFQVLKANVIVSTQSLTATTVDNTFSGQGTFTWKVTAQNVLTSSQPSLPRSITVDTTKPLEPVPFAPVSDTTSENPVLLKWNNTIASDTFAIADFCQLQISSDSTFVIISTKDTVISVKANPMIYNFNDAVPGNLYYWRVKAIDKAGNSSPYFTRRRIKRN